MEKDVEDVTHNEKHVPHLLEAIMRPRGLVSEALRLILSKLSQFRSKITKKSMVCTVQMSTKNTDSHQRPTQQASQVSINPITAPQTRKNQKQLWF